MKPKWIFAILLLLAVFLLWRFWSEKPIPPSGLADRADRIRVEKSKRKLHLLRDGHVLKTYSISLGKNPIGHKTTEGDQKTPEGIYLINGRNPNSAYHLSLRISYPNAADEAQAKARGVNAGFDIMIHGLPNGTPALASGTSWGDWTAGCIAVNDAEIEEIWNAVPDGAPIEILP